MASPTRRTSASSPPVPMTAEEAEEAAALAESKGALFARPSGARSSVSGVKPSRALSEEEESARVAAESEAVMAALGAELNSGEDVAGLSDALDSLDLTTSDASLDFDGVDLDLARFKENPRVKRALEEGKDLRVYSREIEAELAALEQQCVADYVALAAPGSAFLRDSSTAAGDSVDRDVDALSLLHSELSGCDEILASMESMLTHFQADLANISGEIQTLQERSNGMGVKLRNYKGAERALHSFIQLAYIPDDLANVVLEGDMNEAFVAALTELDRKLMFLHQQHHSEQQQAILAPGYGRTSTPGDASTSLAARDMWPLADKLRLKAVARIRAFLLERFHSLKKPKTNVQIKQNVLLKFSPLYQFLLHHADTNPGASTPHGIGLGQGSFRQPSSSNLGLPSSSNTSLASPGSASLPGSGSGLDIPGEVRREYHETMSAIYHAKFKKYLAELTKLQQTEGLVRKSDTLGNNEGESGSDGGYGGSSAGSKDGGGMGGMLSGLWSSAKRSGGSIDHVFRLGSRDDVLNSSSNPDGSPSSSGGGGGGGVSASATEGDLIVPHLLAGSQTKIPFERLFKSAQALLMDTATAEYDFIVEFFGERMVRDMDRAGMHEDAIQAEKEAAESKATGGAGVGPAGSPSASTSAKSYHLSPSDERGRSQLLPGSRDKDLFKLVFGRTVSLFLDHLDAALHSCHDALGVLILIRIVCQHNIQMQFRRVHCLDHMFDRMNMTLWPKFKTIFDANVESVITLKAQPIKDGRKPHMLCHRYGEFASGILRLNQGYSDPILTANLARLSNEVNKFLLRSAASGPSPRTQVVYLLNSYHSILHILGVVHGVVGRDSDEYRFWAAQLASQQAHYVELELGDKFGAVIRGIKDAEARAGVGRDGGNAAAAAAPLSQSEKKLIRDTIVGASLAFAGTDPSDARKPWIEGIKKLHEGIQASFAHEADTSGGGGGGGRGGSQAAATSATARGGGAPSPAAASSAFALELFQQLLSQLFIYHSRLARLIKDQLQTSELEPQVRSAINRFPNANDVKGVIKQYA